MTMDRKTNREPAEARKFVEALARGLEVLSCFHPSDRYLGNQDIAKRTKLPKSTVSRLTYTLSELGYLNYSQTTNKYSLGNAVIALGYAKLGQMDIRRISRPLMQALAEHTQASVNLGIRDHLNLIYIDTYRNTATLTVQLDVGSQIPIATTSMGRAYLCVMPEDERNELMAQIKANDEQNWPTVKAGFDQAMAEYRQFGYCTSLGNWRTEVHAVAVPLVLDDGTIMGFSCSGASFQLSRQLIENDIGPRLINLVGNVRTALTFAKS
ncbi:IclR family transcriptional regulator [Geotalea sp. SG265]|uniref:IclR family transcriptional regulator n=1 Tax=Geotalea sp. SG265 TaxID=2922867 RepID=UPI001FAFA401|nr:IclR family transcriptional regulator [Geotalea sp. SG265]